jgi:hypothetical protein
MKSSQRSAMHMNCAPLAIVSCSRTLRTLSMREALCRSTRGVAGVSAGWAEVDTILIVSTCVPHKQVVFDVLCERS